MEVFVKPRQRERAGMFTVRSRSWASVIAFYRDMPWAGPMAYLAETIASSRYGPHLYPVTSMHTIVIGQTPEFDWNDGVLRIEPMFEQDVIVGVRFVYVESPSATGHWARDCRIDDAFGVLERFLARAHWFVEYRTAE